MPGIGLCPAANENHTLQAEITVSTDYVFRGYSRSASEPAAQAGLNYRHRSGVFGSLWGSTVDFEFDEFAAEEPDGEVRVLGGYGRPVGRNWSWNALIVRDEFLNADMDLDASYTEALVSARFRGLIAVTAAWSPEFLGSEFRSFFLEISGSYPLPLGFSVSAGGGRADLEIDEFDYLYGHLAAGWSAGLFSLDLGYYGGGGQPIPPWGEVVDGSWVLSASARFP